MAHMEMSQNEVPFFLYWYALRGHKKGNSFWDISISRYLRLANAPANHQLTWWRHLCCRQHHPEEGGRWCYPISSRWPGLENILCSSVLYMRKLSIYIYIDKIAPFVRPRYAQLWPGRKKRRLVIPSRSRPSWPSMLVARLDVRIIYLAKAYLTWFHDMHIWSTKPCPIVFLVGVQNENIQCLL